MQNKNKKKKQALIKISIIVIALVIITIIATNAKTIGNTISTRIAKKENSKEKEPVVNTDISSLKGIYVYNDNVKYEFNNDNTGTLYDGNNKYKYTYKILDQQITFTFEDTTIHESTYTAYFVDGDLKLIGGEGTVGGEYILKKEKY